MESMSEWKEKLRYLPHNMVGHPLMRLFQLFGLWGYQSGYTTRRCPSNLDIIAKYCETSTITATKESPYYSRDYQ